MTVDATLEVRESAGARKPGAGAWLLLTSLLLWLGVFVIAPTGILLVYSFFRSGGAGEVQAGFTLESYRQALAGVYVRIFVRSIGYAALTTTLCLVIGYPAAFYIARAPRAWRNRILLLLMIPFTTSFLIRAYAWVVILRDHGVLNALLEQLRIVPAVLPHGLWPLDTPAAVFIGLVYTYLPFMILPIYGSAEKLDASLLEAAWDLGAGPLRTFWRVALPLTWPGVAGGILLVFVPSVAMFAVTSLLGGGRVLLIGDVIADQFGAAGNLPLGAALSILLLGLFLTSFLVFAWRGGRRE